MDSFPLMIVLFSPAGRTLRLPSECPGQRAVWVLMSSPRMAPCPPSPPVHSTKSPPTPITTSCSSTPSTPPQTPPPSSQLRAAPLGTGHPATMGRLLPPTTTTTTAAPCHMDSPSPRTPPPGGTPSPYRSVAASCPRPRPCLRPSANRRVPPSHHRCPRPPSQLPTSAAWEGCPSWCLLRTRPGLWSNRKSQRVSSEEKHLEKMEAEDGHLFHFTVYVSNCGKLLFP